MKKFFKDVVKNECKDNIFFNYDCGEYDETIEARRYIGLKDKISLADFIWDIYYDSETNTFNVPILEPIIRMMIIRYYCVSPKLGAEDDIAKLYPFLMCTNFYKELCANIPDIAEALKCIHKTIEFNTNNVKNNIDRMITSILHKVDSMIPQDFDMNDALNTYKSLISMNNDDALVDKILDYHKDMEAGSDEGNNQQGV